MLRFLPLWLLRRRYISVGAWIGDAVSYSYLGAAIGMDRKMRTLQRYENEWVRRGNFAWTLAEFQDYGGYGIALPTRTALSSRAKGGW